MWLERHKTELETEDVLAFWEACAASGPVVAQSLARFVGWLTVPTPQQVAEVAGLVRLLSVPALRHRLVELLRRWGDPPPRTRLPDDCPAELPADLVALLRRLAFYQRMAGKTCGCRSRSASPWRRPPARNAKRRTCGGWETGSTRSKRPAYGTWKRGRPRLRRG